MTLTFSTHFWKAHCFNFFPVQKHTGPSLTLPYNRSVSTQEHPFNKFGSQVSSSSAFQFQRRRFREFFSIYGHGRHLGRDINHLYSLSFLHPTEGSTIYGFNRSSVFLGKEALKYWIRVTLDQSQWMTLTFDIHEGSCTNLVDCIYQLWYHWLFVSEKSIVLPFSLRCIPNFKVIGLLVTEKIFKGFYHISAWWPYWACDLDDLKKLSFPHPMEDTNDIWLQST